MQSAALKLMKSREIQCIFIVLVFVFDWTKQRDYITIMQNFL